MKAKYNVSTFYLQKITFEITLDISLSLSLSVLVQMSFHLSDPAVLT